MKNMLLAAAATMAMWAAVASAQAAIPWKAVAINGRGDFAFAYNFYSEEEARQAAIAQCEQSWARTCFETRSVPMYGWTLSVIMCDGRPSSGGSQYGAAGADQQAINNAGGWCNFWYVVGRR